MKKRVKSTSEAIPKSKPSKANTTGKYSIIPGNCAKKNEGGEEKTDEIERGLFVQVAGILV